MSYSRFFMPLLQEAKGYEFKGRTPAGRCIVEERGGMGKISLWVQDLKDQTKYGVYLVFADGRQHAGVHMGLLDVNASGKAELKRDIAPGELHMYALDEMVAVAVIATNASGIVSPLCGYKNQQMSWRHSFFVKEKEQERPVLETPPPVVTRPADPADIEELPVMEMPLIDLVKEPEDLTRIRDVHPVVQAQARIPEPPMQATVPPVELPSQPVKSPPAAERPQMLEQPPRIPEFEVAPEESTHSLKESAESPPMARRPQVSTPPPPPEPPPEEFTQDPPPPGPPRATRPPDATATRPGQSMRPPSPTQSRESTIQLLEAIFNANISIEPFARQNRPVKWVRCNQFEQMPLPGNRPNLANEQFMLDSWASYEHFIVGITTEGEPLQYIIGVAGVYTPEDKRTAMQLGFAQFKGVKKDPTRVGDDGYWLMFVDF